MVKYNPPPLGRLELSDLYPTCQTHFLPPMTGYMPQHICTKLKDFYGKADLTDFVIICGNQYWNVHRLVLALHSDVLHRACSSGFKVHASRSHSITAPC